MDIIDYSTEDRLNQLGATVFEGSCMLIAALLSLRVAIAVLRASGTYWLWLLLVLAVWCSVSFVRACQIISPRPPSQKLKAAQQQMTNGMDNSRTSAAAGSSTLLDQSQMS